MILIQTQIHVYDAEDLLAMECLCDNKPLYIATASVSLQYSGPA